MTMRRRVPQTQEKIDRYGRINGDNDIIHYDHDYAVARGFRGTLNHGMMTMGYIAGMAAEKFGRDWFFNGEIRVKWIDPVCPGDVLDIAIAGDGAVEASVAEGPVARGQVRLVRSGDADGDAQK